MHRPGMGPSFTPAYRPPTINTGPNMAAINAQRNYQSQMQMQHQNQMRFQQEQTMRTMQQNQQNMLNNMARQQQQQQMDRMRQEQMNNMHRQNMARVQQDQARMRDEHQRTLQNNLRRAADDQRRANEQRHRAEMDRHRARMNLLHTSNNNNSYAANGGGGGMGGGGGGASPFTVYVNGVPLFSTPDPNDPSYTGESDGNVGIGVSASGGYGGDDDLHLNAPLLANMFGPPSGNAQYYTGAGQQQQQPTISIPLARNNKGHIVIEDMSTEPLVRFLFFIGLAFFIVPPLCIVLIVLAFTSKTYYVEVHESKKQLLIGTKRILTGGVSIQQKIHFSDIASFELVSPLSGQITGGIQFQSFSHQLLCAKTKTGVAYSLLSDTYGVQQDRLRQLREWLEKTNPTPPPPTAPPAEDGAGTSGNDGNGNAPAPAPENRGSETQSNPPPTLPPMEPTAPTDGNDAPTSDE